MISSRVGEDHAMSCCICNVSKLCHRSCGRGTKDVGPSCLVCPENVCIAGPDNWQQYKSCEYKGYGCTTCISLEFYFRYLELVVCRIHKDNYPRTGSMNSRLPGIRNIEVLHSHRVDLLQCPNPRLQFQICLTSCIFHMGSESD